ncbi:MAG: hypothetical protein IJI83_07330 [Oscillospiraceae bacterium]|nr:hypothetical protein [Oscillospiraceae bacterium]MBQ6493750.1 hypothetical protein [Erysipelotrichaceae bacterium]
MTTASTIIGALALISLILTFVVDSPILLLLSLISSLIGIPLGLISLKKGKKIGLILSVISLILIGIFFFIVFKLDDAGYFGF